MKDWKPERHGHLTGRGWRKRLLFGLIGNVGGSVLGNWPLFKTQDIVTSPSSFFLSLYLPICDPLMHSCFWSKHPEESLFLIRIQHESVWKRCDLKKMWSYLWHLTTNQVCECVNMGSHCISEPAAWCGDGSVSAGEMTSERGELNGDCVEIHWGPKTTFPTWLFEK